MQAGAPTMGRVQAPAARAAPSRVVIGAIRPLVDCGRYAAKGIAGEAVTVEADVLADGHDLVGAALVWRAAGDGPWARAVMEPLGDDRHRGAFTPPAPGGYEFAVEGWIDRFGSWKRDLERRRVEVEVGGCAAISGEAAPLGRPRARDRLGAIEVDRRGGEEREVDVAVAARDHGRSRNGASAHGPLSPACALDPVYAVAAPCR